MNCVHKWDIRKVKGVAGRGNFSTCRNFFSRLSLDLFFSPGSSPLQELVLGGGWVGGIFYCRNLNLDTLRSLNA